jgi:hypothetical protein
MTVLVNILLYTELLEKKKKQLQINPSQHPEKIYSKQQNSLMSIEISNNYNNFMNRTEKNKKYKN